jgi:hypothetical protein
MNHVIAALETLDQRQASTIQVRRAAADQFHHELTTALKDTVWHSGCTNWYVDEKGHDPNQWPWTWSELRRRTATIEPSAYEVA